MAQNLGDIVLGSYQAVQDASQRRFQRGVQTRELEQQDRRLSQFDEQLDISRAADQRAQAEADRTNLIRSRDAFIQTLDTEGYVSADRLSINVDALAEGIEKGSGTAATAALKIANMSGLLPEGSTAESIERMPDGGHAVTVRNPDGSLGAVTDDGSSDPESRVVILAPGVLSKVSNTIYQTKILPLSSFNASDMRMQLTRIDADSANSALMDQANMLVYKTEVINAVPVERGAQRAAINAVSAAETPEEEAEILEKIGADLGIAAPETGQIGRNREMRDRSAATVAARAEEKLANKQAQLKSAQDRAARTTGRAKDSALSQARRLEEEIKGLQGEPEGTPSQTEITLATPEAEQEVEQVVSFAQDKSTSEISDAISSGDLTVSAGTQRQVAASLEDKGIRELKDLLRLNDRDRAIARAAILASSPNATIQAQMSKEISNIFETGRASISAKDERAFQQNEQTLRLRAGELKRGLDNDLTGRTDNATRLASDFTSAAQKLFFGEDGSENNLNSTAATEFTRTILAPYLLKAANSRSAEEAAIYQRGISPSLSLTVAAFAAEEEGGIAESLLSFFRADSEDVLSTTDFDLSRVKATYDADGRIKQFFYLDADGAPADEAIDAGVIRDLNDDIYKIVAAAARRNTNTPENSES